MPLSMPKHRCSQNISFLPTGSPVVVLREDGEPWMHWMIGGCQTDDHNGKSHRVRVTKTVHALTRMKRYIKHTNRSAEDYL